MADKKTFRLVWFQHLSKAAGTSIVELARANGEKFYPHNANGNPRKNDGSLIRLWEMNATELTGFIDHCEREDITFVANEWGGPDFSLLASDPRVKLITCLRDPFERFLSNYYYGYHYGYTDCISPESYNDSEKTIWGLYTRNNYYCRMFSRRHHEADLITDEHFELAKSNLALFDSCTLIRGRESFSEIKRLLGWNDNQVYANRNILDSGSLTRQLLTGKVKLLWRRLVNPKKQPDDAFRNHFLEQNIWDYKLIQACTFDRSTTTKPVDDAIR